MMAIDGAQEVTVAALIVAARRLMKPWQSEPPDEQYLRGMAELICDAAGLTSHDELVTVHRMITRLYVPVTAEQIAELEAAVEAEQ